MRYLLLVLGVIFISGMSYSQSDLRLEIHTASDYILTPEYPRYEYYGYDNQFGLRYGVGVSVKVLERLRLGIGADSYTRKEDFECVHFPDPEITPQSNWQPLINNPTYSCDYRIESRIRFLEVPISVSYSYIARNKLDAFVKLGYGYQFIMSRKKSLTDLQTGSESTEHLRPTSLISNNSFRISTGCWRTYSEKLQLGLSLIYRSDNFQFEYQSIGLEFGLSYRI